MLQSQPNFIVVLSEKLTCDSMTQQVTADFVLPTVCGRGFSSVDSLHEVYKYFCRERAKYGKKKLILILATDFDPSGEAMVDNCWHFFHDDMRVRRQEIEIIKAMLRQDQTHDLHENATEAKSNKKHYRAWERRYGKHQLTYELEALEPAAYQDQMRDSIKSVIDLELFNTEGTKAEADAERIERIRAKAMEILADIDIEDD